jgi:hypothetical protein
MLTLRYSDERLNTIEIVIRDTCEITIADKEKTSEINQILTISETKMLFTALKSACFSHALFNANFSVSKHRESKINFAKDEFTSNEISIPISKIGCHNLYFKNFCEEVIEIIDAL